MLLNFTLLVARYTFVVVLIFFAGQTDWWTSAKISAECYVVGWSNEF